MKKIPLLIIVTFCVLLACKQEPKAPKKENSIPEKIALAHGYENWKSVKELTFTFNVDRDTNHLERTWVWKPKSNKITSIIGADTLKYNRKAMDSVAQKRNAVFINDRYWILAPYNLMWDQGNYNYEHAANQTAPVSGESMQKLTIVYGNEGGYTPGDAYDLYFKEDFILREWVFRKANQLEPSMTTTWEDYVVLKGLHLARDHRKAEPGFSLNFTDLEVKVD